MIDFVRMPIFQMPAQYSVADINKARAAIQVLHEAGKSAKEIAKTVGYTIPATHKAIKAIKERGGNHVAKKKSGRPVTLTTPANVRKVKEMVRKNPVRSSHDVARALHMSPTSAQCLVSKAGLKNLKSLNRPMTSKVGVERRFSRAEKLLQWLKDNSRTRSGAPTRAVLWSDESNFVIDQIANTQNRRILAPKADVNKQAVFRSKHPASVMVFGLFASDGNVMPPVFIPKGIKMDGPWYLANIIPAIESWAKSVYGRFWRQRVVLMQDGAPCHTADKVQKHLRDNWGEEAFWSKTMWPPSSPDLNPLDFWAWSVLKSKTNLKRQPNIEALKDAIKKAWDEVLTPEAVKKACAAVAGRLEKAVAAEGLQFM